MLPYPERPLRSGGFSVHPWTEMDLDCMRQASEDPEILRGTSVPSAFTPDEGLAFIHRQWSRATEGVGVSQAIVESATDRAVGLVIVSPRPQVHVAGVGYWVVPAARRRGAASTALALVKGVGIPGPGPPEAGGMGGAEQCGVPTGSGQCGLRA